MNKKERLVDRWMKALRSGDYVQTTGCLNRTHFGPVKPGERYCCLGVLTHLIDPDDVTLKDGVHLSSEIMEQLREEEGWNAHPFLKYWENGDLDLVYNDDGATTNAVLMNDNWRWTFDQIADALERTFRSGGRKDLRPHTWTRGVA